MNVMEAGLLLMGYGLAGVFSVLILIFFSIKAITKFFPYKDENK